VTATRQLAVIAAVRAAGHARRGGDGLPGLRPGPQWVFDQRGSFTLPAFFCGFEVQVAPVVNKEYSKVLRASDGPVTVLAAGSLKISYTNLQTGKTITVNRSGPGTVTVFAAARRS
jgi:hypothetical protein